MIEDITKTMKDGFKETKDGSRNLLENLKTTNENVNRVQDNIEDKDMSKTIASNLWPIESTLKVNTHGLKRIAATLKTIISNLRMS